MSSHGTDAHTYRQQPSHLLSYSHDNSSFGNAEDILPTKWMKYRHLQEEEVQTLFVELMEQVEFKESKLSLKEGGFMRHIALASLSCLRSIRNQESEEGSQIHIAGWSAMTVLMIIPLSTGHIDHTFEKLICLNRKALSLFPGGVGHV